MLNGENNIHNDNGEQIFPVSNIFSAGQLKKFIGNIKKYCKTQTRKIILSGVAVIASVSIFCFMADTAWAEFQLKNQVSDMAAKQSEDEKIKEELLSRAKELEHQLAILREENKNISESESKTQQELDEIKAQQEQKEKELFEELEKIQKYINENYTPKISGTSASRGTTQNVSAPVADPLLVQLENLYNKVVEYKGANTATEDLRITIEAAKVQYLGYINQLPDARPIKGGRLSSGFGYRRDPFTGKTAFHSGIDIAAPRGTSIYAAGAGKVTFSGYNSSGYGYMVEIQHNNGLKTVYAHCSKLYVKTGDFVGKGDLIAAVGSTGRSTGPHLHFEVRVNGKAVDPRQYVKF